MQTVFAFQSLLSIFPQFMEAIGASVRVFELLDRVPRVNYDGKIFDKDYAFCFGMPCNLIHIVKSN